MTVAESAWIEWMEREVCVINFAIAFEMPGKVIAADIG